MLGSDEIELPFFFSKFGHKWQHFRTEIVEGNTSKHLPRTVAFTVVITSKSYDPERYAAITKVLADAYKGPGGVGNLLTGFLSIFRTGNWEAGSYGKFILADYDVRKAYFASSIKDVIVMFGLEVILLWVAMLLRKKVVVYSDRLSTLLPVVRAAPLFVWHRQNWGLLRPFVTMTDAELADMSGCGAVVAGFTDARIKSRSDLFDILIDIPSQSILVGENSKADFALGSYHKEIALLLTKTAEDAETTDQAIVKTITMKVHLLPSFFFLLSSLSLFIYIFFLYAFGVDV